MEDAGGDEAGLSGCGQDEDGQTAADHGGAASGVGGLPAPESSGGIEDVEQLEEGGGLSEAHPRVGFPCAEDGDRAA